jgi:hypothetical protein
MNFTLYSKAQALKHHSSYLRIRVRTANSTWLQETEFAKETAVADFFSWTFSILFANNVLLRG